MPRLQRLMSNRKTTWAAGPDYYIFAPLALRFPGRFLFLWLTYALAGGGADVAGFAVVRVAARSMITRAAW